MNKKLYADRLSDLVLNLGVALKKGEHLNIAVSPDAYYYAQNMAIKAYEMGAMDYINRPFDAQVVYRRVFNTIKLYAKQRRLIALVTDQIKSELKK